MPYETPHDWNDEPFPKCSQCFKLKSPAEAGRECKRSRRGQPEAIRLIKSKGPRETPPASSVLEVDTRWGSLRLWRTPESFREGGGTMASADIYGMEVEWEAPGWGVMALRSNLLPQCEGMAFVIEVADPAELVVWQSHMRPVDGVIHPRAATGEQRDGVVVQFPGMDT